MNTELVRAVFDCGIDDLRLLDDAECDMYAVIGRMREESIELTKNNIIQQVFEEGRYILTKAREEKIASLPAEPMTEADFELRRNLGRLNPEQDFSFWINLQDTNFRGKSELKELYESMFAEELDQSSSVSLRFLLFPGTGSNTTALLVLVCLSEQTYLSACPWQMLRTLHSRLQLS